MELAAAAPVADAVGAEAEAADLDREHARAEGVQGARGHADEVALGDGDAAAVLIADRVVCRGRAQGIDVVGLRAQDDRRAGLGLHDVPGLGLLVVVLVRLGVGLVGVHLDREALRRAHGDDLDDAVVREVAHDLRAVPGQELVERGAVVRASLDVVHEPAVDRDVERLAVRDVALDAAQTVDGAARPHGRDQVRFEQQRSHKRLL